MGRAPLWCHARCAAFALALALACLSGARALSSDVLMLVGDVPSANVHKSFPVVGRPRTFPPGPTVTGTVRLGTVRERAFPSRADTAGVPGTAFPDAVPVDAKTPAAREDARGTLREAVVEDVARAEEDAGDAPAHAKTEDVFGDVCLTRAARFETAQLDLTSAVTAMVPALVAALAVSASAALGLARAAAAAAAFAAASASSARRFLGGVVYCGRFGFFGKNPIGLFTRAFARTEIEPDMEPHGTARTLRSRAAPLAREALARRRVPGDESLLSRRGAVRGAARRGGDKRTKGSRAREQASPATHRRRRLRERSSSSEGERFGSATVADGDADGGRRLATSRAAFSAANTPPPRRSTRLRKAARASPTSHFEGIESGATSGSSADESPAFDSEEDREERPRETWREQMTDIFRAVGHRR